MHYYSGPQLVEIFARKRRHKLGKYGALGSPEKKCAQGGGRLHGGEGCLLAGFNKSKTKAILNASSSIVGGRRRHANT